MASTFRTNYRELSGAENESVRQIKDTADQLLTVIESLGGSRELSLARTKLEESVMWAVKHVTG